MPYLFLSNYVYDVLWHLLIKEVVVPEKFNRLETKKGGSFL